MKVFISHSSHDKWVARQISSLLERDGHNTFLDEKDIKTGESIDASIQLHLKDSDHLLLLITPASITSHWVFVELGAAKALGKHVVPIYMHVGSNELPSPIAGLLGRDINELDKYFAELKKITNAPTSHMKKAGVVGKKANPASKSTARRVGSFAVGEVVRIADVDLLTEEDKSKSPKWVTNMDKYSGATAKITAFSPGGSAYLDVTGDVFRWNLDWLTKAG